MYKVYESRNNFSRNLRFSHTSFVMIKTQDLGSDAILGTQVLTIRGFDSRVLKTCYVKDFFADCTEFKIVLQSKWTKFEHIIFQVMPKIVLVNVYLNLVDGKSTKIDKRVCVFMI